VLEVKGPAWMVEERAEADENQCGSAERMSDFTSSAPDLYAFTMTNPAEESKMWCCHTQIYTGASDINVFPLLTHLGERWGEMKR